MKPNKARRVPRLLLEKMTAIDYATLAALGGTASFVERLVRARISVAVAGLSHPTSRDGAQVRSQLSRFAQHCFSPQQQSKKKKQTHGLLFFLAPNVGKRG